MMTDQVAKPCPKCQAVLPENAPQGLCTRCLLAAVATSTEAGQPADKDTFPAIATVADAFPHLEIIELIGQGGMGLVYKARQPKLERLVALKLLPQTLAANPTFAERFNREARVLARLNHPSIVTVHDFGQAGGFFYLLMEFVDGVNLRQAMHAGRFTPQQAMMLVPRICEALQFAHDEGILHRDIKPENILLDSRGRVKIADFGIAKLVGEAQEQLTLTASGMAVGTPHYMAPEQLEHPNDVDQRADIYSLGVVFYEMLTGELPIGRFAPPSQKATMDPRVDDVVFHALEKEREKRFRTATEVRTSLEAITSTTMPSGMTAGETRTSPASTDSPGLLETRTACYFNTPKRMRDCFPSAAARIFTCKGELILNPDGLTFISPWQTIIRIPLKNIEDLSVGQFQMWTTPWVMKYARLNFISVSFRQDGELQTVHLTPAPPEPVSSSQINLYVGRWFDRLQQAFKQSVGTTPHASDPEWLVISAEPAWNRKGLPLAFAFALTSLAAWILLPQPSVPTAVSLPVFGLSILLLIGTLWFAAGFLQANRALWRGDLDAVTSDEPSSADSGSGVAAAPVLKRRRFRSLNASALAIIALGLVIPVGMLFWEAWVFPTFGERIFGKHSATITASKLVMDTVPLLAGPGQRDPRQSGGGAWNFICLMPPDHLVQFLFVRWTNGAPIPEPGLSAYFKTGHTSVGMPVFISCEPPMEPSSTTPNVLLWNVNMGLGYTPGTLLPIEPSFRSLDAPARMTLVSGHQRSVRLLDYPEQSGARRTAPNGVELRVLLKPLKSPAMRSVPSEKELNNCIGGAGLELPMDEMLKLMNQLPINP
jgi:serine/threonine protein kinase